jgi:hypothetical protein
MEDIKVNETNETNETEDEAREHEGPCLADILGAVLGGAVHMPVLGRYPFVILQLVPNPDAPDTGYGIDVSAGGGITNKETLAAIVLDAAAHLNALNPAEMVERADEARVAAGLRPLAEYAFTDAPDVEPNAPHMEPAKN